MRIVPAILGLVVCSASSLAQQTANAPETRSVIVNVLDRQGAPFRDLTKDNFVARMNGKPVEVLDARYSVAPRRIVLLLDLSVSMTGEREALKWRIAREGVNDLLAQTPHDVSISLLAFATTIQARFDFSQGRDAIAKWFAAGGQERFRDAKGKKTALYDSIAEALKLLNPVQPGDSLYAITDGGDNASKSPLLRTKTALLQSGVRLYLLVPPDSLKTFWYSEGIDSLIDLANDSGGLVFGDIGQLRSPYADDYREAIRAYTRELSLNVNEFWILQLEAPASSKPTKFKLEVADYSTEKSMSAFQLTYPRLLPPAR